MNRSKRAVRGGYTLSEMLVVLGVLVVVAALAQPALRSALGDSRLRSASRQVAAALAKARLKAMQSGVAHRFRYQVGKSRFEVAPASLAIDGDQARRPMLAASRLARRRNAPWPMAPKRSLRRGPSNRICPLG